MADNIKKTIEVEVNVEDQNLDKAAKGVEKITKATDSHTKSLDNNKKGLLENGGAMGLLGAATSGLAMDFKDAIEAIQGMGIKLKGLNGIIAGTLIGGLAIVILELITNWEKWSGVIDKSTAATERLNEQIAQTAVEYDKVAIAREASIAAGEAQGVSEDELHRRRMAQFAETKDRINEQIAEKQAAIDIEENSIWKNKEFIAATQEEIKKLETDRLKNSTAANLEWQKNQFRLTQEEVDNMIKADDEKFASQKRLNDKLIALTKSRTELNIREIETLLKEFERINDSFNSLDVGRYGEVYSRLKGVFDIYTSGQKNLLDSENKLKELAKEKRGASNDEIKVILQKEKLLKAELELKKQGFDSIINPQLKKEIALIQELAKEEIARGEKRKLETFEIEMLTIDQINAESKRAASIEDTYNRQARVTEILFKREEKRLAGILRAQQDQKKALEGSLTAYTDIKNILDKTDPKKALSADDIKSLNQYSEQINKLFGYKVDLKTLTEEQRNKILNEYYSLNDKILSVTNENGKTQNEANELISQNNINIAQNEADKIMAIEDAKLQHKQDMLDAEMGLAESAAGLLSVFAEDSKDLMRASIIADSAIGIGKMIISNNQANIGALATPQAILTSGVSAQPIIAMNNIATGLGIAANIAATAKALSKVGGGGADTGGAGAAAAPQAKFNIVGSSSSNQLAATIAAQQQQPVKAYVVGTDMTTQQALDRNIQKNATFL